MAIDVFAASSYFQPGSVLFCTQRITVRKEKREKKRSKEEKREGGRKKRGRGNRRCSILSKYLGIETIRALIKLLYYIFHLPMTLFEMVEERRKRREKGVR